MNKFEILNLRDRQMREFLRTASPKIILRDETSHLASIPRAEDYSTKISAFTCGQVQSAFIKS